MTKNRDELQAVVAELEEKVSSHTNHCTITKEGLTSKEGLAEALTEPMPQHSVKKKIWFAALTSV